MVAATLHRRLLAEFLGSTFLAATMIGSLGALALVAIGGPYPGLSGEEAAEIIVPADAAIRGETVNG